jgi:RimJ/RimL family protein N-acetyltransferase/catechol 2,3-dioxygenase-like lactoylglutathione lyase family enzyme
VIQPSLSTARLTLDPATDADLDILWSIWRDADVRRYLFDDVPVTRERAAEILRAGRVFAADGLGLWVVRLRGELEVLGTVGLMRVSTSAEYDPRLTGAVEPVAALAPGVWGRGYAREALGAVISYAFAALRLPEIAAVNDVPNEASGRLVRQLGFHLTGECDGPHYRMRTYRLTAQAFNDSAARAPSNTRRIPMRLQDAYPIIVTDRLFECRDFYVRFFGLEVGFQASWFVYLTAGDNGRATLAFMHPEHPSAPPGPEPFSGKGMCLEFQVEDAASAHERFLKDGAPVSHGLRDEPFGQRRFGLFDPAGVWIDVVQQIEPAAGFWERYPAPR